MSKAGNKIEVYAESGKRRTMVCAVEWPGWCRGGRDEETALQALADYGARYGRIMKAGGIKFTVPEVSDLHVVEHLEGTATTDFGVPDKELESDARPLDDEELERLQAIMKACWSAFDAAVEAARNKELRKGPRGGGRELDGIVRHVVGSEASYISSLGGQAPKSIKTLSDNAAPNPEQIEELRQAILDTLTARANGEEPAVGKRGGRRWSPRYFVRRDAWHVLDHVWEIEDRAE